MKSEKTLSDSHALYQEQIQSLKEACRTKDVMISKRLEIIENLIATNITTTAIALLQTTAAIMILESQDQRIHIWRHHSGSYYQQPLMQQQLQIMGDRLRPYQAFQLKSNYVRRDYKKMSSLRNIRHCTRKRKRGKT